VFDLLSFLHTSYIRGGLDHFIDTFTLERKVICVQKPEVLLRSS